MGSGYIKMRKALVVRMALVIISELLQRKGQATQKCWIERKKPAIHFEERYGVYPLLKKFVGIVSRIFPSGNGVRSAWRDRQMIGLIGARDRAWSRASMCRKCMPTHCSPRAR